jgi:hypothetical protein
LIRVPLTIGGDAVYARCPEETVVEPSGCREVAD